nr:DUF3140 domain-containing protein [Streptomyces boncukensis]
MWAEFHRAVNMTSRELDAWLRTSAAQETSEEVPEHAGPEAGRHVLAILQKRRTDLTDEDVRVMARVVDTVAAERRTDASEPGGTAWRHRMMTLGHDPLKTA